MSNDLILSIKNTLAKVGVDDETRAVAGKGGGGGGGKGGGQGMAWAGAKEAAKAADFEGGAQHVIISTAHPAGTYLDRHPKKSSWSLRAQIPS